MAWQLGYQPSRVERDGASAIVRRRLRRRLRAPVHALDPRRRGRVERLLRRVLRRGAQVQDMRTFQEHAAPGRGAN